MKFEELFNQFLEGKKIARPDWDLNQYLHKDNFFKISDWLLYNDFEIREETKPKVKYYPAIIKYKLDLPFIALHKYRDLEHAKTFWSDKNPESIYLITEIPELIEEREE